MDSPAFSGRLPEHLRLRTTPVAADDAVVRGDRWRFTVLTDRLLRLEYNDQGQFEDRATQLAVNREFPVPPFRVVREGDHVRILTAHLQLSFDGGPFSPNGLSVTVTGNLSAHSSTWRYGVDGRTLGGTARTLDDANGPVALEPGVVSRDGYAVLDDTSTLALEEDGWFSPRSAEATTSRRDLYLFGYGHNYRQAITDFYRLAGATPLIPRFALGNWWSRYYRYSQAEYVTLMERFQAEGIPFSVAVLDMDWHHVDVDPRYGSGWTGYTWNTDLFPDPDALAAWLHHRGLRLTLNVHPADGVQAHEDAYSQMAQALGVDPATGDPIVFDVTDPQFIRAYFAVLHHPLEARGVDFWWVDWQSGSHSRIVGLDPLWVLNHLHFLDSGREGRLPLTFSRYAGPGSHRYPIGFSGDTVVSWKSLHFQPYFTSTATNIGYGWWSHDIGGHLGGGRDDDLAVRWTQFGVFSPIMRLHSSSGQFNGKEPWRYGAEAAAVMGEYLRLRHRLVPYLHTMNHAAASGGLPLVTPMYYDHPDVPEAYTVPNQYHFGSDLLVSPITAPLEPRTKLARVKAWLPEGLWIDFFTGLIYRGGRTIYLHRTTQHIPVLARAGAVIPLAAGENVMDAAVNPSELEVLLFGGGAGGFDLVEDSNGQQISHTLMTLSWDTHEFVMHPSTGDPSLLPDARAITIVCVGFAEPGEVQVWLSGRRIHPPVTVDVANNRVTVRCDIVAPHDELRVRFTSGMHLGDNRVHSRVYELVADALIDFDLKQAITTITDAVPPPSSGLGAASQLQALDLDPMLLGAILEILEANTH